MGRGTSQTRNDRVLAVVQENAASLLRLARRHSLCADDAQDAYQRALEIYLRKLDEVDEGTAGAYLRTVVKHEAMAIREQRQRFVGDDQVDLDAWMSESEHGEERALAFDRLTRAAEALQACKRDEVGAMVLKAEGHSYREISAMTGWSFTKVNRCLTEGRSRFLTRYAAIEAGEECERLSPILSAIVDGEAGEAEMAAARPHLRNCPACRAMLRELQEAQPAIHALLPGGVVAGGGPGLVARLWEIVFGSAQHAGLKVQAALEAASATKIAAVAASAAAVAGGGAMVAERTPSSSVAEPPAPLRAQSAPNATAGAPAPAGPITTGVTGVPADATLGIRREAPPVSVDTDADREREPRRRPREFQFENAGTAPAVRPAPVSARAAAVAPAATPAPTPAPSRTGRSDGDESFGFER